MEIAAAAASKNDAIASLPADVGHDRSGSHTGQWAGIMNAIQFSLFTYAQIY